MSLINGKLNQTATYWAYNGVDSAGDPSFAAPVSISVRWEDVNKVLVDNSGEERQATSEVWADQDMTVESFLLLGTSVVADPTNLSNAYKIESYSKLPSVDGSEFVRSVLL